ncbi:glycosyltransferase [Solirubrobacter sp. CPCC 204708]|uniref:Glycosyltransferase n=1 Tax=Solirubrobacter deserti TaxID=2282478 RepID=A0ABT4RNW1_9ACTN|nr:glycosyltransferase [Solirubrobacter deserti]MBE2317404.1 glycosyltransferase [Solirubrobacter deserti]MDA0139986.1 glycosyltransferase [Solirubrobacter deserti]
MRVEIVIPNWNGRDLLAAVLPTLADQTFGDQLIRVVDNGSTDGSVEYLQAEWPGVEIVAFDTNRGFAPAVNAGLRAGESEYVALVNNDMELEPQWLERLVAALDAHPDAGAATPKQRSAKDRSRLDGAGDALLRTGAPTRRGFNQPDTGQYDTPERVFSACGGAGLFRRAALQDVGLLDESFFAYLEDADWGFRAQLRGWTTVYVPDAVAYHHGGATTGRVPGRERYLIARNHIAFLLKNYPTPWLLRSSPLIVAGLGHMLLTAAREGQGRIVARGWRAAVRRLPATLRDRRAIQARRAVALPALEAAVFGRPTVNGTLMKRLIEGLWLERAIQAALRATGLGGVPPAPATTPVGPPTRYDVGPFTLDAALRYSAVIDLLSDHFHPQVKILEVGSGAGGITEFMPFPVTGLDAAFDRTEGNATPYLTRVQGRAQAMPFADDEFDLAISVEVFEHIPQDARAAALAEMVRVTRPGGRIIVTFPSGEAARRCDLRLNEAYEARYGQPHPWVIEHIEEGVPDTEAMRAVLAEQVGPGGTVTVHRHANERAWLFQQLVYSAREKFLLTFALGLHFKPGARLVFRALRGRNAEPAYRTILVADLAPRDSR